MSELILAIDDNQRILDLVSLVVRQAGFRVETAASGAEAQEKITIEPPSLIILDMSLPDITGKELLAAIRASSEVPVIILSAMEVAGASVVRFPNVQFISKPFDPSELVTRIKQSLMAG